MNKSFVYAAHAGRCKKMPEPKIKIAIDYKRCDPKRCDQGICAVLLECPSKLVKQIEPYGCPYPVAGFCQECGNCSEACLLKAISAL